MLSIGSGVSKAAKNQWYTFKNSNIEDKSEMLTVLAGNIGMLAIPGVDEAAAAEEAAKAGEVISDVSKVGEVAEVAEAEGSLVTSWKSVKEFGHTFNKHGAGIRNTNNLLGQAKGTGINQGQWLDNQVTANLLNDYKCIAEPTEIEIPNGLGQVIMPNGEIIPTNSAMVIPSKTGIKTAYPILPK